jgi:hypothetical protein
VISDACTAMTVAKATHSVVPQLPTSSLLIFNDLQGFLLRIEYTIGALGYQIGGCFAPRTPALSLFLARAMAFSNIVGFL